mmetsp:Transcript_50000/g.160028  ORF Transcript_50000/g.160028 Transcript_50000/m.160028 type:complete len:378 (+) Transcript_50000:4336-5469(+)
MPREGERSLVQIRRGIVADQELAVDVHQYVPGLQGQVGLGAVELEGALDAQRPDARRRHVQEHPPGTGDSDVIARGTVWLDVGGPEAVPGLLSHLGGRGRAAMAGARLGLNVDRRVRPVLAGEQEGDGPVLVGAVLPPEVGAARGRRGVGDGFVVAQDLRGGVDVVEHLDVVPVAREVEGDPHPRGRRQVEGLELDFVPVQGDAFVPHEGLVVALRHHGEPPRVGVLAVLGVLPGDVRHLGRGVLGDGLRELRRGEERPPAPQAEGVLVQLVTRRVPVDGHLGHLHVGGVRRGAVADNARAPAGLGLAEAGDGEVLPVGHSVRVGALPREAAVDVVEDALEGGPPIDHPVHVDEAHVLEVRHAGAVHARLRERAVRA